MIEQSASAGLDLTGANKVSVTGNFFDDNGKGQGGGAAIEIDNTMTASICGNHLEGNGEYSPTPAQVHFAGANDGIDFCGNVYDDENESGDVTVKPLYVYDADPGTTLTNSRIHESPAPQAKGIFSPNAQPILSQLQVPLNVPGQISGFTLANASPGTAVQITAGTATDSSNSVLIQSPSTCTVDLAGANGEGGLDTGNVMQGMTYFYFVLAQSSGAIPSGVQSCMASLSQTPTFVKTAGGNYNISAQMDAFADDSFVYDVKSVAGIRPGDELKSNASITAGTHVTSVGTITVNTTGYTANAGGNCNATDCIVVNSTDYLNMRDGMSISDGPIRYAPNCALPATAQAIIAGATTITKEGANTILLSPDPKKSISQNNPDCFNISGGNVLYLDQPVPSGGTALGVSDKIFTGVYRLVGALYTNSSNTNLVSFSQDGDTFYLTNSVTDVKTGLVGTLCAPGFGTGPVSCALSVPCGRTAATCASPGLKVQAFGRLVGGTSGGMIIVSSPDQAAQLPNAFPGPPGYTNNNSTSPDTSYPFHVYTDGNGKVRLHASSATNTVYEVTDGWVFRRGP